MKHLLLVLALIATLLTGCVPAPLIKLESSLSEADKAEHVVIFLAQSEVTVDDANTGNMGGGLIGALIQASVESTMTRNRQEALAPMRDQLLDFQFESRLTAAIQANLPTRLVRADAGVKIIRNEDELRQHLADVVPANVLLVTPRYAFEQNFEIAYVHASVGLWRYEQVPPTAAELRKIKKEERKSRLPALLHGGSYMSQQVIAAPFEKYEKQPGESIYERHARLWSANGASAVRKAFSNSLDEVAALIQRDADGGLPAANGAHKVKALLAQPAFGPLQVKVDLLASNEGRSLVQIGQNTHWIDDRQIKR
ncbi:hypothetical protein [Pseudomarimonas arenosa]|uniref:Curli production assembly/transport component CsgG n=1 Tax=Pseudomarimonas arenosa TaxID=2774145 RepID=A0AAW3ZL27_9GAMM|nr:hypothetical protein [Pseudomarimonas arenosa]MBD8526433.1 hypothetical protein [Pseudomarimonas arenosa]